MTSLTHNEGELILRGKNSSAGANLHICSASTWIFTRCKPMDSCRTHDPSTDLVIPSFWWKGNTVPFPNVATNFHLSDLRVVDCGLWNPLENQLPIVPAKHHQNDGSWTLEQDEDGPHPYNLERKPRFLFCRTDFGRTRVARLGLRSVWWWMMMKQSFKITSVSFLWKGSAFSLYF